MKDDREEMLRDLSACVIPVSPEMEGCMDGYSYSASLPLKAQSKAQQLAQFTQRAIVNACEVVNIASDTELPAIVGAYLTSHQLPLRLICEASLLSLPWQQTGIEVDSRERAQAQDKVGITTITAAAADSGAMLQQTPCQLNLSLLPSYHIAVVRQAVIVADLPALWRTLPQPLPHNFSVLCGPSRTADIEQTLTLGAHGPLSVLVVLIGE